MREVLVLGWFFFVYNGDLFVLHLVTNANKP